MICFLARFFVKDYKEIQRTDVRQSYGILSGAIGIALNIILFCIKLFAGIISGSVSIVGDAINNLTDAASSIITLIGFKLSGQEADERHPFGHGRAEYISGLIVAFLIIITGVELFQSSVKKIISPNEIEVSYTVAIILVISIFVKFIMFQGNLQASKLIKSATLNNTAIDSISDVLTTSVVLFAAVLNKFTSVNIDGYVGVLVAIIIVKAGVEAARDTIDPLLGEPPSKELIEDIKKTVLKHRDVLGVHDIMIHNYGATRIFMSLHVEVPSNRDLMTIHDVIDDIENELRKKYYCTAVIHMDPVDLNDRAVAELKRKIRGILDELDPKLSFHDFRIVHHDEEGKPEKICFDVQVPYGYSMKDEEIISYLDDYIRRLLPKAQSEITIDKADM